MDDDLRERADDTGASEHKSCISDAFPGDEIGKNDRPWR
jgi:hypothetical protein